MELTMENIGNLHGVSHSHQTGDLMNAPHARQSSASHRNLVSHGRSAMVSSMASILEGAGDYRTDHALSGPLHPAMTMSCDSGMSLSSTYTTLTPLQHLPPISTVSEKFHHPHPHAHHHPAHQRLAAGNVSGSFTLMRDDRSLASMSNLYGHYPKDMSGMGQPLSPLSNGLGSLHGSQQTLSAYGPGAHLSNDKMLSSGGFESHAAMLSRGEEHLARGLGGHGAGLMTSLNGIHHHSHPHSQANGSMLSDRDRQTVVGGGQGAGSGQVEEINTKEVAQRITAELKRYSIPQAIFAQRILCRSQGTLSDLLRNPKPWSKLKSGRETFRRMWKWLQEPEFQRMSALRLAACKRKEQEQHKDRNTAPKKQRLVFTDLQRRTLIAIFKENKRPSKEMQITISQQLGLELSTVSNFFMNARRRCVDRWHDDHGASPGQPGTSTTTFSKA
ncbi:hepatocyte nuclear factor 6 [Anableps anableps]|uniref:One cut domain family member n=1 Tax=Poecilia formosa TaxID=48698 RepID=A0A087X6C4_POEFO|nr:PREDICTED: hepatocyte nuclear factor 6-like [Poecilia formosa]XP_014839159.1 PREDICTED: hepatocyte nuclear factor 6-like [Poecilia mexicana]XP_014907087.1 PREDICTED: hepatocyte nuclear factor 6-like [Poecilia latipinna]XP_043986133.1 hepatocyte nuclear factor 6 isoform X1 [Gambusia affinis]XP_054914794.1 hepatocyte nuclear factor 6 isoform X1 [Poeciliopsis prolifica]